MSEEFVKRRNDDLGNSKSKRRGEIFVRLPDSWPFIGGLELAASGAVIVLTIVALGMVGLGFFHDDRTQDAHESMVKAQYISACVNTLSAEQKEQYRKFGWYCWDPTTPLPFFVGRTQ